MQNRNAHAPNLDEPYFHPQIQIFLHHPHNSRHWKIVIVSNTHKRKHMSAIYNLLYYVIFFRILYFWHIIYLKNKIILAKFGLYYLIQQYCQAQPKLNFNFTGLKLSLIPQFSDHPTHHIASATDPPGIVRITPSRKLKLDMLATLDPDRRNMK